MWKNRLEELQLPVGPWLRDLKRALAERLPDYHVIRTEETTDGRHEIPLGVLRNVFTTAPGQKIAYVTDVADTPSNRAAVIKLVRNADLLFIEAAFAVKDARLAAERAHLTTAAAGEIARQAAVRRIEPFHFSSRYGGEEAHLKEEVMAAFAGREPEGLNL